MTLLEFQALGIHEGDKIMLSYIMMPTIEPIKTCIIVKRIVIEETDFYLANVRSKYYGHRIKSIESDDTI